MELIHFINENKIENFEKLKVILETTPYNLKIKEDVNYPNLFLIHSCENSDFNLKIVNECNGIILDKNTLKVVCYTFDKCTDSPSLSKNIDIENLYYEYSIEGTLIRLFYNEDKWVFSTKKCIDASIARWISPKNFIELFFDCIIGYDIFKNLNKNNCYSFIIAHPENNIVVQNLVPILYHISTRDMTTLNEIEENIGISKLEKKEIKAEEIEMAITNILNEKNLTYEGVIFIDKNYNRWKIRTLHFDTVRKLWGNSNNKFYRYLELRKDILLMDEYLKYFSHDRDIFINFEIKISEFANIILTTYIDKHIKKINNKIPYYFSKIIYKLHGDYLKDRIMTDHNKIMLLLLEIEPKKLCFMINSYEKSLASEKSLGSEMIIE